jgi:tRNA 2-selenouridine synthase
MIESVSDVGPASLRRFDDVIDVRSPAEFEADRLPRAVNLPVLSNAERAEIGETYIQRSKFLARRAGAAIIARNVARHLETALADKPPKWRPLIYCWRGGQRSQAMATILGQIGWRVATLEGGYKTWRRAVVARLHGPGAPLPVILLDGRTGTAKTEILRRYAARGGAALDLEALAGHRGSVFGGFDDAPQPAQTLFESRLHEKLAEIGARAPIIVEAESAKIGRIALPRRLWESMRAARHVVISADDEARTDYLVRTYADAIAAPDAVEKAITRLKPFHAKADFEKWLALAQDGAFRALVRELSARHYDPLYDRAARRRAHPPIDVIRISDFSDAALDLAAERLEKIAAGARPAAESS